MALICALILPALQVGASAAGEIAYGAATVSATKLHLRTGPGLDYSVITSIPDKTIIVVVDKTDDEWYKVNYGGKIGYVNSSYLVNVLEAENFSARGVIAGDDVRMRTQPDVNADVIAMFASGKEIGVIGINKGWYKVTVDDKTGYIRSDYIDLTGVASGAASALSVPYDSSLGSAVVNLALQFVGYRYVYGGASPSTGFDCSGLVYYVFGQNGCSLSRSASQQYKNNGTPIAKSDLRTGDLVFFSSNGSSVTHVGIYIGDGQFVHASTSNTGVIISSLDSSYYLRVWFGAKRISA